MHLFALLTMKSMSSASMSMGMPPKLLIASTMKIFPYFLTIFPTSSMGFSMPVVVSE